MKRFIVLAAAGLALAAGGPAWSQIGDLHGQTACCAPACIGGQQVRCGDLVAAGLSHNLAGCAGVDGEIPDTCVGGQLLDAGDQALLDGCLCLLGTCVGPLSTSGGQLTEEQCAQAAATGCFEAGNFIADGPCGGGGCNPACRPDQVCNSSNQCVCAPTRTECGNPPQCVNLQTDNANCGTCGNTCTSTQTCQGGQCVNNACPAGQTECPAGSGHCVDTQTDEANCGACGNACAAGQTCEGGVCTGGGTCSGTEDPCSSKADCCPGLQCVDKSATVHQKVCRHGQP